MITESKGQEEIVRKVEKDLLYNDRAFLNKEGFGTGAHMIGRIELFREYENDKLSSVWVNNILFISDCERKISLSLDMGKDDNSNSLYKINILVDMLSKMREALKKQVKLYEKYNKEIKK